MDIVARRFNDAFTLSLGARDRFPEAALRADEAHGLGLLARQLPRRNRFRTGCANCSTLWRHQPPSRYDLHRIEEVFPSASYQYVLYGMGFRPEPRSVTRRADDADRADGFFREAAALTGKMLAALPSNRELIEHIKRNGLQQNLGAGRPAWRRTFC